jgi:hypothetical protein
LKDSIKGFFFLKAFCDISHRLGGITPFGVSSPTPSQASRCGSPPLALLQIF